MEGKRISVVDGQPKMAECATLFRPTLACTAKQALNVSMVYTPKVILHAPSPDSPHLCEFVEACLRDKVGLICVVGDDCEVVEDIIDELVVADGSNEGRFLVTTSHKNESLQDVIEFAKNWSEIKGDVSEVTLS